MNKFVKSKVKERLRNYVSSVRKSNRFCLNASNVVCYAFEPTTDLIGFHGGPEFNDFQASMDYLKSSNSSFDCALDVGSNIGITSLYLSNYFKHVYSFEPNPKTYRLLKLNAEACLTKNIFPNELALSDKAGTVEICDFNPFHSGMTRMNPLESQLSNRFSEKFAITNYTAQADTIDNFVKNNKISNVSLLKLDVESHEENVLFGASSTIEKFSPAIIFEDWLTRNSNESELRTHLRGLGYKNFLTLNTDIDDLIKSEKKIWRCINWPYKILFRSWSFSPSLVKNHTSKVAGYEHVLAVK